MNPHQNMTQLNNAKKLRFTRQIQLLQRNQLRERSSQSKFHRFHAIIAQVQVRDVAEPAGVLIQLQQQKLQLTCRHGYSSLLRGAGKFND